MPLFDHVRLRNGLGWISPARRLVTPPLDRDAFTVAPGADERSVRFYLVETPRWIAVVPAPDPGGDQATLDEEGVALLQDAGCFAVVQLGPEGPGAAVVEAWPSGDDVLVEAGAAVWAVKAIAGWDEARLMAFAITCWPSPSSEAERIHGRTTTLSVRGTVHEVGGTVDVRLPRPGAGRAFAALVAARGGPAGCGVVLGDLDQLRELNDAYGHRVGDLAVARVGRALEALADDLGAVYMRTGGDEFGLLLDDRGAAAAAAEEMERVVAALAIPLAHPSLRTASHLAITAVALDERDVAGGADPFRGALDRQDAAKAAKRAARNIR